MDVHPHYGMVLWCTLHGDWSIPNVSCDIWELTRASSWQDLEGHQSHLLTFLPTAPCQLLLHIIAFQRSPQKNWNIRSESNATVLQLNRLKYLEISTFGDGTLTCELVDKISTHYCVFTNRFVAATFFRTCRNWHEPITAETVHLLHHVEICWNIFRERRSIFPQREMGLRFRGCLCLWSLKQSIGSTTGQCTTTFAFLKDVTHKFQVDDRSKMCSSGSVNLNWLVVFRHPSEKYEFVNWDDDRNPIFLGKCQIHGNQSPPTSKGFHGTVVFLQRGTSWQQGPQLLPP